MHKFILQFIFASDIFRRTTSANRDVNIGSYCCLYLDPAYYRSQGGGAMNHTTAFTSFKYNGDQSSRSRRRRSSCADNNGSAEVADRFLQAAASDPSRLAGSPGESDPDRLPASHNHLKRYGSIAQLSCVPKTGPYLCTGYVLIIVRC